MRDRGLEGWSRPFTGARGWREAESGAKLQAVLLERREWDLQGEGAALWKRNTGVGLPGEARSVRNHRAHVRSG